MPIVKLLEFSDSSKIAVWEVRESLDELLKMSPHYAVIECNEIKNENRKKEWLVARIMLQSQFNETGKVVYSVFGKPSIKDSSSSISISHSNKYVAIIWSQNQNVAIDIEVPTPKLLKLAHKFMNKGELVDANNMLSKTCLYWCSKEVLYKAYEKKGLIFKDNLLVQPFPIHKNGTLNASIKVEQSTQQFELYYLYEEPYYLVYCICVAV